jgi:3-hydroxyisobutyrate dehydrogenase-like beta-hydroxyacid dehydrogenase
MEAPVNVGVVGLGRMGRPIARRLLKAGHEVAVYNRSPGPAEELGAECAQATDSPSGVWDTAEVAITMIADDKALRAVTLEDGGLLTQPRSGGVLIDMSTVSVHASREVAEAAERAGVDYLRAPVSGNPAVVEAGNLAIVVSGDQAVFERLRSVLQDIGPHLFHVGPAEEARVMKLALNLMIAGTAQLMAESLVLGEANGLERATMLEVMGGSAIGSPFVKYKTAGLVADDYTSTFPTSAMIKDLALALETGNSAGVPLPVTPLVQQFLRACMSAGMGELDFIALVPALRQAAGLSRPTD